MTKVNSSTTQKSATNRNRSQLDKFKLFFEQTDVQEDNSTRKKPQ